MRRLLALVALAALLVAACAGDEGGDPVPTLFDDSTSTSEVSADGSSSSTTTTTTAPISTRLPPLPTDIPGAVRAADGTLRAVIGTDGEVWNIRGACRETAVEPASTAVLVGPQHIVLDPAGGGGDDDDAARLLVLADAVAEDLREHDIAVTLTRTSDSPLSGETRGAAGAAVGAAAFITLALGDGGESTTAPRPAVHHQSDDAESRRLGGLVHTHLRAALVAIGGEWSALADAGVRPLLNQRGEDYFAVLRSSAPPAVRVEVLASAGRETALLDDEEGRSTIAMALAEAIARFLVTDEIGDGYVEPENPVRQAPTSNTPGGCP